MIKWFVGNRSIVMLLLPVIVIIFVGLNLWLSFDQFTAHTNLGIWGDNFPFSIWWTAILGPILALVNAIFITSMFNTNSLIDRNTYVSGLIYLAFYSFFRSFYQLDGLSISHLLLLLTFFEIFKLQGNESGKKSIFNAGLFAGVAMTFHPAILVFFPFLLIMILVIRPFILREFFLLLAGFSVPLIYAFLFYFYFEKTIDLKVITSATNFEKETLDLIITILLFGIAILVGLLALNKQSQKTSIRAKKLMRILLIFTIACLILGTLDYINFGQIQRFSFVFIPFSFFLTFGFQIKSFQWLSSTLLYIVLAYSVGKLFLWI